MSEQIKLMSGEYEGLTWQFFICDEVPDLNLVTAVACLALKDDDVVIVENTRRAWEFPGGHVEVDESWDETVRREVLEEASCSISDPVLFGYQEFLYKEKFKDYPFPRALILYYVAQVTSVLSDNPMNPDEIVCRDLVPASVAIQRLENDFQKKVVSYHLDPAQETSEL